MIVEQKKIKCLGNLWEKLYLSNSNLSPYQSYQFQSIIGKGWTDKRLFLCFNLKELTLLVTDNGEPTVIAPFVIRKSKHKIHIYLRGTFSSAAHLDFIYGPNWDYVSFKKIMDFIIFKFPSCHFHFNRILESSITNKYIMSYFSSKNIKCSLETCAEISIPDDFNSYFQTLNKKARQNIRTSFNRLEKNGLKHHIETHYYASIPFFRYLKMLWLYTALLERKNDINGVLRLLLKPIIFFVKHLNPMSKALRVLPNGFHCILYINGKIAACLWGFMSNNNRIVLSRLSVDRRYGWYSPGGVMIIELIKELIDKYESLKVNRLDLARGTENYKFVLGADEYHNCYYDYEI